MAEVVQGSSRAAEWPLARPSVETDTAEILHDVRNVLAGIHMFSEIALQSLSDESPARTSLDRIGSACRNAEEMCRAQIAESRRTRDEAPLVLFRCLR